MTTPSIEEEAERFLGSDQRFRRWLALQNAGRTVGWTHRDASNPVARFLREMTGRVYHVRPEAISRQDATGSLPTPAWVQDFLARTARDNPRPRRIDAYAALAALRRNRKKARARSKEQPK
jgi:hypothetical protein